jgi:hypothetical protein
LIVSATARGEQLPGSGYGEEPVASQIALDGSGVRAYRRALAFFLASVVASTIPAFASAGVALLDPPWHVTAPITAAYLAFALVRARAAARELATRRPGQRALHVALVYVTALLFAGLGGATIAWETTRLVDHQLDRGPGHAAIAQRTARRDGPFPTSEYRLVGVDGGTFVVRGHDAPEAIVVEVHDGALGYRWVAAD